MFGSCHQLIMPDCVQMAVTTHNTSLPAAERYKTGMQYGEILWSSCIDVQVSFGFLPIQVDTIFP